MRLLLDSHTVLWWLFDVPRLGEKARRAISAADRGVVSAASVWEIGIKQALGKLHAPESLPEAIQANGWDGLAITMRHAEIAAQLPRLHGDPFDRMLVAQARCEDLVLVTADRRIAAYDVQVLAATT